MPTPSHETSDTFQIRRATVADAAAIAKLFLKSSDGLATYIWARDKPEDVELLAHGTARYARRNTAFSYENCHVATVGDTVVGMVHAFEMPETDPGQAPDPGQTSNSDPDPILQPYTELELPGSLYVSGLAVADGWQGRGIGTALLATAEAQAADIGQISLVCFERNAGAMRLYTRRGYREVDRRPLVPHPSLKYRSGDAVLLARAVGARTSD